MISIITSLYRSDAHTEKYAQRLQKCADELIAANISFEVICIANDPTELEKRIGDSLGKYPWFKFAPVPRESIYATWNRGVGMARGTIYTFWNVDDIRFSEAIAAGVKLIESGEAQLVYFPFIYKRYVRIFNIPILAKRKIIIPEAFSKQVFMKTMQCGPFFMFSKSAIESIGLFDATFTIAGDYEWCVRAAKSDMRFLRCRTIAGIFTNDGMTLSGSRSSRHNEENERVVKKYA